MSIDFNHDPHSSTMALGQTKVMADDTLCLSDNEWSFSNRTADTAVALTKTFDGLTSSSPMAFHGPFQPAARVCESSSTS